MNNLNDYRLSHGNLMVSDDGDTPRETSLDSDDDSFAGRVPFYVASLDLELWGNDSSIERGDDLTE
jgi:hypothetical protein